VQDLLQSRQHPDAAGIDLAATEAVVALPPERAAEVRTFSLYTQGLYALRDWLLACGIHTVAMESTGNYWVCLYEVLEEAGIAVWLVNARHVKAVPGRKTDVCDAQWLQQLHSCGLLKKAFRPALQIAGLRYVMRHRAGLLQRATAALQAVQKTLVECNLRLHHVFSDLDGVSGPRMVEAILAGERDPQKLAALRDRRCRTPLSEVLEALQGHYRPALLFVLGQDWAYWKQTREALQACDQQLEALLQACTTEEPAPEARLGAVARAHKNSFGFDLQKEGLRFYGVDLCTMPGFSTSSLAVLLSEVGPRDELLKYFPNAQAFSSWLCLCPENRITGGKVFAAKTRPSSSRLSAALRMAAMALGHAKNALGDFCRRMKARLGKAEGITAVAHKLARMLYAMIATRQTYDESKAFALTPRRKARQLAHLQRQATRLGFALIPTPAT
jgi:transposase